MKKVISNYQSVLVERTLCHSKKDQNIETYMLGKQGTLNPPLLDPFPEIPLGKSG
jgi:hypothetical protein